MKETYWSAYQKGNTGKHTTTCSLSYWEPLLIAACFLTATKPQLTHCTYWHLTISPVSQSIRWLIYPEERVSSLNKSNPIHHSVIYSSLTPWPFTVILHTRIIHVLTIYSFAHYSPSHIPYPGPLVIQLQSSGKPVCLELRPKCTLAQVYTCLCVSSVLPVVFQWSSSCDPVCSNYAN